MGSSFGCPLIFASLTFAILSACSSSGISSVSEVSGTTATTGANIKSGQVVASAPTPTPAVNLSAQATTVERWLERQHGPERYANDRCTYDDDEFHAHLYGSRWHRDAVDHRDRCLTGSARESQRDARIDCRGRQVDGYMDDEQRDCL